MTSRRTLYGLAAAGAATIALAGCGSSASHSPTAAPGGSGASHSAAADPPASGPTLRVGDQAGTGAEALLGAAGLLDKLPFKVSWSDFTSGPPLLSAMSSGSVDIGGVGDAPPVFAAAAGAAIKIVGARANDPKSAALLVPSASPIHSIAQLRGKRIAVAQGTSADYHLLTVLKAAGLSVHDVTLEYLQPAQAIAAFASGSVDAWDVWSPFIEEAEAKDRACVLVDGTRYGSNFAFEVASRAAIANPAKAAEIRAYLKLLNQAYRWTDSHPEAWAATWAKATGVPLSVMTRAARDDSTQPVAVSPSTIAGEQSLVDAFAAAGLIPRKYDFAAFVTDSFNDTVK